MSFSIRIGNFLYQNFFWLYRPVYYQFKIKQDKHEIELLQKLIKPGDHVLDIGANIGFYAELLAKLVGNSGTVHCFEPDKKNYSYLLKAVQKFKQVTCNQLAVGSKSETLKFYTSPNLNVDHRSYEPEQYDSVTEVNAVAIDDYVSKLSVPIDLIKMDIQGFEMQALNGMHHTLNNNPQIKLISEFWPYGLKSAGTSISHYFNTLQTFGFKVFLMDQGALKLLNSEDVAKLEGLSEEHYFNILATKRDV